MKKIETSFYQGIQIKAIVTGSNGFLGRHFTSYLSKIGVETYSISTKSFPAKNNFNITYKNELNFFNDVISHIQPDLIYHFAGSSDHSNLYDMFYVNTIWGLKLLESIEKNNLTKSCKVFFMGSASEYGKPINTSVPLDEESVCNPITPYGLSKLHQTNFALEWSNAYDGNISIIRPFTILGKGMPTHLAIGSFFQQLKTLSTDINLKNKAKVLKTGNLDSLRDFIDVQDAVKVLWNLSNNPNTKNQIINLCTNNAISIREMLLSLIDKFKIDIEIVQDLDRVRSNDISCIYGNNSKLKSLIGNYTFVTWKESLNKMVNENE